MIKFIKERWLSIFDNGDLSIQLNTKGLTPAIQVVLDLLKYIEENDSFRVFEVKDDIKVWCNQNYGIWEQNLTLEEIKNIKLYTSNSFKFNEHLRNNRFPNYNRRIHHIDSALEKSSIPENIVSFRWLDIDGLRHFTGSTIIHNGTEFLERGYSSTTLLFKGNSQYCPGDVLFILKIPKYFNGAYLKNISNLPSEDECLLKRNTIYTVENIIYHTDTNVILLCNVQ